MIPTPTLARSALLGLALSAVPAAAQSDDLVARLEGSPGLAARMAWNGLPTLATDFESTNAAAMLQSGEMRSWAAQLSEALPGGEGLEEFTTFLQQYPGRTTVYVLLGAWDDETAQPGFALCAHMSKDPTVVEVPRMFDDAVDAMMADLEWSDLELPGLPVLTTASVGEGVRVSRPALLENGGVFWCASNRMDRMLGELFAAAEPAAARLPEDGSDAPVGMSLRFAPMLRLVGDLMEADETAPKEVVEAVMRRFRLDTVLDATITMRAQDRYLVSDSLWRERPGAPGLFDLFVPDERSSIVDLAPREAGDWVASPLDLPALLDQGVALARELAGDEMVESMRAQTEEQMGVDLLELIPTLGKSLLMITPTTEETLEDDANVSLALALADGARFEEILDKILRSQGLHVARRKTTYREHELYSLPLLGVLPLNYAVVEDHLLFAFGADARDDLQAMTDALADRALGREPAPFPEGIQQRIDAAPGGWIGLQVARLGALGAVAEALRADPEVDVDLMPAEERAAFELAVGFFDTMGPLVDQFDLQRQVTLTYRSEDTVRQLSIW